jgi:hypothetical protein
VIPVLGLRTRLPAYVTSHGVRSHYSARRTRAWILGDFCPPFRGVASDANQVHCHSSAMQRIDIADLFRFHVLPNNWRERWTMELPVRYPFVKNLVISLTRNWGKSLFRMYSINPMRYSHRFRKHIAADQSPSCISLWISGVPAMPQRHLRQPSLRQTLSPHPPSQASASLPETPIKTTMETYTQAPTSPHRHSTTIEQ